MGAAGTSAATAAAEARQCQDLLLKTRDFLDSCEVLRRQAVAEAPEDAAGLAYDVG